MSWRRALRLSALLLAALVLAFLVAKESREPHLWLLIDDLLRPKPSPDLLSLSNGLSLRLYHDTRPHVGKVARLQKGLVLESQGRALIEEGFGFGLPLVEMDGQAYLSRSASVRWEGDALVKDYHLDTLDTPSGFLRRKYEPVPSVGTVTVSYSALDDEVHINVDLGDLKPQWDKAYVMNEQGARTFTRYEEPGLVVDGEQLGIWQPTTASTGCIVADDGNLQFCVDTDFAGSRYYGRERYKQYYWIGIYQLSWAGIDLELSYPQHTLDYTVRIERLDRD